MTGSHSEFPVNRSQTVQIKNLFSPTHGRLNRSGRNFPSLPLGRHGPAADRRFQPQRIWQTVMGSRLKWLGHSAAPEGRASAHACKAVVRSLGARPPHPRRRARLTWVHLPGLTRRVKSQEGACELRGSDLWDQQGCRLHDGFPMAAPRATPHGEPSPLTILHESDTQEEHRTVKFRAQACDVLEQLPTRAEKWRREALPGPVAAERACQNLPEPSRTFQMEHRQGVLPTAARWAQVSKSVCMCH